MRVAMIINAATSAEAGRTCRRAAGRAAAYKRPADEDGTTKPPATAGTRASSTQSLTNVTPGDETEHMAVRPISWPKLSGSG